MKRDIDLIRRILLDVEESEAGTPHMRIFFDGEFTDDVVNAHIELMVDAGLVEGSVTRSTQGIVRANVRRLTWAGHDFLDATRDATIWAKAKKTVLQKGSSFTIDLLLAWAKKEAAEKLGLSLG